MSAQPEVWRVSTVEGVFETDLDTLRQWILEGCVLPTDKVSKGNLNWIDAGRVPKLKAAFNGETTPVPEPVTNSFEAFVESSSAYPVPSTTSVEPPRVSTAPATTACHNHPEAEPEYVCRMCGGLFCKQCTRFVSGKVPVCPLCGDLCREYRAVTEKTARAEFQGSGFGMEDFVRAIRYPLQHKVALLSGALIYAFLLLAGFRGSVVAWVVLFGCISHVISQVAWGRLNRSFMPDFSAFSLWDDLVVPVFLGIGIMIVSWGPVIALVIVLMFGVLSGGGVEASSLAGGDQVAESLTQEDLAVLTDPEADPKKLEEANKKLQATRPGAQIAHEAEQSKEEASDPAGVFRDLLPYLGAGISIALLFLLFIGWGLFYYPMALTVAGYTQSFGSVLNPLVGLDTIRRMGATYFKAFGMVAMVHVVAFVVGVIVSVITSPLTLPFMGNLAGNFINATFTFYFNLVVACILGLSLFKCADRLGINVD
ncbi:MAG TPA: hypothetical protein VFY67_15755 [Pyrinomonadaceae bacterium]|nr:hypothetical protein [Pyrinomonadaceae bacterium]